jgi:hypothetical protein
VQCSFQILSQVDFHLGKAYYDWGYISDAVSVYDKLSTEHPEDFRGYLAKVLLKLPISLMLYLGQLIKYF